MTPRAAPGPRSSARSSACAWASTTGCSARAPAPSSSSPSPGSPACRWGNGSAKAVNLATNIAAFAAFAHGGSVLFALGLAAGLFGIAGNFLGTRSFMKGGARIARPVMIIVMAVFLCRVIWDLFMK